jgi:predicted deacylase
MNEKILIGKINLTDLKYGSTNRIRVPIASNGLGDAYEVPVSIIKGIEDGPVICITAAVHGNELNGIFIIFDFLKSIKPHKLRGTIIAVPVINISGYLENSRFFAATYDLNRLFPGDLAGSRGSVYTHYIMKEIINKCNYLVDLHTASFGRSNSLYVRADMTDEITTRMAYLQNPQIIVHNKGADGTLRSAASDLGIHAITVEVGNPQIIQKKLIKYSLNGLQNLLSSLKMIPKPEGKIKGTPVICKKSYWLFTNTGGILEVLPDVTERIKKNQLIAYLKNVYGDVIDEYYAPEDAIVVGKSLNPVGDAGSRIIHLGIEGDL